MAFRYRPMSAKFRATSIVAADVWGQTWTSRPRRTREHRTLLTVTELSGTALLNLNPKAITLLTLCTHSPDGALGMEAPYVQFKCPQLRLALGLKIPREASWTLSDSVGFNFTPHCRRVLIHKLPHDVSWAGYGGLVISISTFHGRPRH